MAAREASSSRHEVLEALEECGRLVTLMDMYAERGGSDAVSLMQREAASLVYAAEALQEAAMYLDVL